MNFPTAVFLPVYIMVSSLFIMESEAQVRKREAHLTPASVHVANRNVLSIHPLSLLTSKLKIGFEKKLNERSGLKFIGALALADFSNYYEAEKMSAFNAELQFRFYPGTGKMAGQQALKGFYIAPFVLYKYMDYYPSAIGFSQLGHSTMSAAATGFVLGYQLISARSISVDAYAGGGFMWATGKREAMEFEPLDQYENGVITHLGFNCGFSF